LWLPFIVSLWFCLVCLFDDFIEKINVILLHGVSRDLIFFIIITSGQIKTTRLWGKTTYDFVVALRAMRQSVSSCRTGSITIIVEMKLGI
jgi:hypothetical protein